MLDEELVALIESANIEQYYKSKREDTETYAGLIESSLDRSVNTVHRHIRCTLCRVRPIVGARYHCLQCKQDYCIKCETIAEHPHELTAFVTPIAKEQQRYITLSLDMIVKDSGMRNLLRKFYKESRVV